MGKIEQNREHKRRTILASAQAVFLEDGYMSANMDRIAAQAQVNKTDGLPLFPLQDRAVPRLFAAYGGRVPRNAPTIIWTIPTHNGPCPGSRPASSRPI